MPYKQRWKTVRKIERRKPKELLGVYEIPQEALWLVADIETLTLMQAMLDRLQATSFVERNADKYAVRKDQAYKTLRRLAFLIGLMKRIAEVNLTDDYLLGEKIKSRPNKQTIAEAWRLIMDGFGAAD